MHPPARRPHHAIRQAIANHQRLRVPDIIPEHERIDAAVLVPLRLGSTPAVTMLVRDRALRQHGGEVSFPGGKREDGDASLEATAIREAHEEIGLDPQDVVVAGRLSSIPVATSAYRINPFVGLVAERHVHRVDSHEVERVVDLPLQALVDGTYPFRALPVRWAGVDVMSPFFALDEETLLYGASALVLVELLGVVGPVLGWTLGEPEVVDGPPPWMRRTRG